MTKQDKLLYTLIPLDTFKGQMGIDDREEKTAKFYLLTATYTIEQYCKRRLLRKKHFERIEYYGSLFISFKKLEWNIFCSNN